MTNIGSGYSVAPTVNINVGEIAWSANQSYTVGELINVGLELYEVTTAGTSGTAAFSGQSSIPQPADGGTCFYAYVGERASLQAFVESRVYIKIQNAVKFTDVDTIKSTELLSKGNLSPGLITISTDSCSSMSTQIYVIFLETK